MTSNRLLSINMKATLSLLVLFTVAIALALVATIATNTLDVQLLAAGLVTPQVICVSSSFIIAEKEGFGAMLAHRFLVRSECCFA